jgi:PBP1b-binding outer membrane lipoprotein LpoB
MIKMLVAIVFSILFLSGCTEVNNQKQVMPAEMPEDFNFTFNSLLKAKTPIKHYLQLKVVMIKWLKQINSNSPGFSYPELLLIYLIQIVTTTVEAEASQSKIGFSRHRLTPCLCLNVSQAGTRTCQ